MIHVFGPFLRLWDITEEEKEAALQELSENNETASKCSLFEQSFLLLVHVFSTTSYFRRTNILKSLIDSKSKVNEILREQSEFLNDARNQFLFGGHFENEFSKSDNANPKTRHFSLACKSTAKNKSIFQCGSKNKSTGIGSPKIFEKSGFSKCAFINKEACFCRKRSPIYLQRGDSFFCEELAKSNQRSSNPELCGRLQDLFS